MAFVAALVIGSWAIAIAMGWRQLLGRPRGGGAASGDARGDGGAGNEGHL